MQDERQSTLGERRPEAIVLDVTRREALSMARDPRIVSAVRSVRSPARPGAVDPLLSELYARSADFEFRNVAVLDSTGTTLGEWHARTADQAGNDDDAVREAVKTGQPAWGCPHFGRNAIAIPLGTISAMKQNSWIDLAVRTFSIAGLATPAFWLGIVSILIVLDVTQWVTGQPWMPPIDYVPLWQDPIRNLSIVMLPALTIGYRYAAVSMRMTRSAMLE